MLRTAKLLLLRTANATGVTSLVLGSPWRRQKLLILCYHGIAMEDEHLWNPGLFIPPQLFRERLESLRASQANVLPLGEAVERLYAGTLPPQSAAITFDDGFYNFVRLAQPLLAEFGYPATVYLTTYYSDFNRPVFDVMSQYMLWKARSIEKSRRRLEWPGVLPESLTLDDAGRTAADRIIKTVAKQRDLSGRQKDQLLAELASRLELDYEALCAKRIMNLMTGEEAAEVARAGTTLELHTHRHRVSVHREKFEREIRDNRERLRAISPAPARHFCYPGGFHLPQFPGWLRECGVVSATTCASGLATPQNDPLLLPRLVDTCMLTSAEFTAWISGLGSLLPQRAYPMSEGQLMEEEV
jgi:peptidoglycan/xylan/chitin deacetylase (PgdA/CDA1 family)